MTNKEIKAEMYSRTFPFDPIHNYCESIRDKLWINENQPPTQNPKLITWSTIGRVSLILPQEIADIETFDKIAFIGKTQFEFCQVIPNVSDCSNILLSTKNIWFPLDEISNHIKFILFYRTMLDGTERVNWYEPWMCKMSIEIETISAHG
jgi:hypothetical protein